MSHSGDGITVSSHVSVLDSCTDSHITES